MTMIPTRIAAVVRHPLTLPFYLPALLFNIAVGLIKPLLPLYAADFGVPYVVIGIILASDALGTVLGDIPAGFLLRRFRDKQVMVIGLAVVVMSVIMLFFAQTVPMAILFLFIFGVGRALFNVSTHMYLMDTVRLGNRGRAIASFGGIGRIGNTIGPALGGFVATVYNLRAPFLLFGVIGALAIVLIVLLLHSQDKHEHGREGHEFSFKVMLGANSRTLAIAGAGQLFAQMIRAGRNVIIPLYASDVLGLDPQAIGIIVSVSWALDMTLFYPAGWIMDNLGRKYAIVPSFIIQTIGMALVAFSTSFVGLLFAAGLIGLANGISSGTMMTLGADLAPPDSRGDFLGVWRLIGDVGATGAPLVVG
ncbi:MAG: MFS transporter, partial [Anaerolineae bacterium]|nr:MFS transporter [Anaerolineae bacterium]